MVLDREHPDPVIRAFLNSEPTPEALIAALSGLPEVNHPKVQAMLALVLAESGVRSLEEANELAQAAYQHPSHVDLHILFVSFWYGSLIGHDEPPLGQLKALESVLTALVSESTPPELKAIASLMIGYPCSVSGNHRRKFELIESFMTDISRESQYYSKFGGLYAMIFLWHGRGTKVAALLEEIEIPQFDRPGFQMAQLSDCALTGKLELVPSLLEDLKASGMHKYKRAFGNLHQMTCELLRVMGGVEEHLLPFESVGSFPCSSYWIRSTEALLKGDADEAIHWAKLHADAGSEFKNTIWLEFLDHTLVRAELSNGNGRAAKRLLCELRERGSVNIIDQFFFARAERLLGNHSAAAVHFAKLQESVERYEATKRLDFEARIACELAPTDLLKFGIDASKVSQEITVEHTFKTPVKKGIEAIVSASPKMEEVKESILQFAGLSHPVLITGETGTGKELVAQAIHEHSNRANAPFLAINCAAIPDALIESELFGHASGAFTGAEKSYNGLFRDAAQGTVFLDEIADISPRLQVALLRVLETSEVKPVGSSSVFTVHCRVIAATNRDLSHLVARKTFRSDLFFRLQRLEVLLPPLRDRTEDIALLADHFLNTGRGSSERAECSRAMQERFEAYSWPGNVRELRNVVERIRLLNSDRLQYGSEDLHWPAESVVPEIREESVSQVSPKEEVVEGIRETVPSPEPKEKREDLSTRLHEFLSERDSMLRRRERICEMFDHVEKLKPSEIASFLGVGRRTVSRDLAVLCEEGVLKKITPTASSRSNYYIKLT